MIGFFDSGVGGLAIFKEVEKLLPSYSYLYLGDNARAPYGFHSPEVIYRFTLQGIRWLFKKGAKLVILACNTASAVALRRIQQEFLPQHFPERRVLGIIIPTAEEVVSLTKSKEIGILATQATVHSFAYPKEIAKLDSSIKTHQQACPLLVPIIEAGELEWEGLELAVKKYVNQLLEKSSKLDVAVLACTHYALIENIFKKFFPSSVAVFSQGPIVAQKLAIYLKAHPEIDSELKKEGERIFYTTEDSWRVRNLFHLFLERKDLDLKKVSLF
ncbi:MAG: glutamate racemase [Candidatus Parcubacteria bacterium]|nr:glutamate racemase [Patescibacteria group bacterium]BCX15811.1 MAG: glutamate racemase [Candidatus Parcubacteria bacterium]